MVKVITYGTYDLLHYGHIRLLERAKALGDYLIVGVTADDFDISRGKINVQQSLIERIEAVRATGLADEIIVEEYEGQKIDDIQKYNIDVFTVGSDWIGLFDYLKEYCKVVYLDRTIGVSSSELRSQERELTIGVIGESPVIKKFVSESKYVNGVRVSGVFTHNDSLFYDTPDSIFFYKTFEELVHNSESIYVASHPSLHYEQIKYALKEGKHVIYESPITLNKKQAIELFNLADKNHCILYAGIKTAYSIGYSRMILMAKTGKIGRIISVDAVCTSLNDILNCKKPEDYIKKWNSISAWGPTAMLPVFQLLGTEFKVRNIVSYDHPTIEGFDLFTKIDWVYSDAVASIKVGKGVKSEGELVITGTKGYIYVPAPWWKTDYYEIRYENPALTKRFFYQLDGEGIRNMIVSFVKSINSNKIAYIKSEISLAITETIEYFENNNKYLI